MEKVGADTPGLCDPTVGSEPPRECGRRLYTQPDAIDMAPCGPLIGSPKIYIDSTNMAEANALRHEAASSFMTTES